MNGETSDRHPFVPSRGSPTESELESLQDEIREEAYRIYLKECAAGQWRHPQDNWMDAVVVVLERHGFKHGQTAPGVH